jgi:hypothetical protein
MLQVRATVDHLRGFELGARIVGDVFCLQCVGYRSPNCVQRFPMGDTVLVRADPKTPEHLHTSWVPATVIINTGIRCVVDLDDGSSTVVVVSFLHEDWQSCLRVLADAPGDGRHVDVYAELMRRDQKFLELLAAAGHRVVEMPALGDCLFCALAYAMHGNASRHPEVRTAICNYMNEHRDEVAAMVQRLEPEGTTVDGYITRMSRPTEWGGDYEIDVAQNLFNIRIVAVVLTADDGLGELPYREHAQNRRTVMLSHHRGVHWNALEQQPKGIGGGPGDGVSGTAD